MWTLDFFLSATGREPSCILLAAYVDELYIRFVDEIKILFNISHPNIVRIYNYYLYPNAKTGFLQMEYVDGLCINQYEPMPWDKKGWEEIFAEVIGAFEYNQEYKKKEESLWCKRSVYNSKV